MADDKGGFSYDPSANYDEATMAQQQEIEKEVADQQPLIGEREELGNLEKEYEEDDIYIQKIKNLESTYKCMRRTRGDGNCFYRAFGFAYLERLIDHQEEYKRFYDVMSKSKESLVALGFPEFTIEDFHETFMDVLQKVGGTGFKVEDLYKAFNDQGMSDYMVVYMRLLVSGHLQKAENVEFFTNFVEGERGLKDFCNQEVEPMGKESDHIHIIALTAATNIPIRVIYLDRGEGNTSHAYNFPESSEPTLHLLYRPGHYDILYT